MNMLISAMSTSSKLTVCLIFLIVVLVLEAGAFVGLFLWKKKVMSPAKKPSAQATPVLENTEAQEPAAETQEPVAEAQPADSGEQPVAAETEAAQPVADDSQNQVEHEVSAPVDTTVAQEENNNNNNNNNTLEGDNPNA